MTVVIRPDPRDRFIMIWVEGRPTEAVNQHQDIAFEVYTSDGRLLASGTTRAGLDKALGGLRVFNDRIALKDAALKNENIRRAADMIEAAAAADEGAKLAVRATEEGIDVAAIPDGNNAPEPDDLDWQADDRPSAALML
ncbi:hypothetical protein IB270_30460 [Ensifer sp. ENS05]|uniref:hypothetical protein n=1 Tax=Ensifer sp. ENS05 TaxID=2769277 RepID=UPI00177B6475|nr:hypothetical protein [Ensifer sp. ENS05]MBD9597161.1 hypothetical protein [Ensifer sp. ENS05]